MADHLRNQIRDRAVVAVTSLTTTGANVFQSRVYPVEDASLPCLLVYTTSEVLDTLDLISKEVEVALATTGIVTAGGSSLVEKHHLESTDIDIITTETRPLGVVSMAYYVQYRTSFSAPDIVV